MLSKEAEKKYKELNEELQKGMHKAAEIRKYPKEKTNAINSFIEGKIDVGDLEKKLNLRRQDCYRKNFGNGIEKLNNYLDKFR
ncbi:MAG: hypothetical protein J7J92_03605 [Candidatus Aenigmarchaeota archaeon]|nr:hypothetical protein [Candidatus Aenigmarchaeota archaeon]